MAFLSLLSLVQSLVVWVGLAAGLVYCVWGSSRGRVSVGDTVLFISMMQQLYVPLTFFGSYYRQVRPAAQRLPYTQSVMVHKQSVTGHAHRWTWECGTRGFVSLHTSGCRPTCAVQSPTGHVTLLCVVCTECLNSCVVPPIACIKPAWHTCWDSLRLCTLCLNLCVVPPM